MEISTAVHLIAWAILTGIFIWGGLEWYAAVLLGMIAPFVGAILALPLNFVIVGILPASFSHGKPDAETVPFICMGVSHLLVFGGAILLAISMRKEKR
jgi:hypothetical protein